MNFLISLYRAWVPQSIRNAVWHVRRLIHPEVRRSVLYDLRIAMGKPVAQVTVNGLRLFVDCRDSGVGKVIYLYRTYEPVETAFLSRILKPGMMFFDVGANIGYFTTLAAKAVGKGGTVLAAEPDPENFKLIERNVRENRLANVILLNCALGTCPGEALLFRSPNNKGDHRLYNDSDCFRELVPVPVDTVDNILAQGHISRLDVIKIDVQGYEQHVLAGMSRTLARNRHLTVLTEFWPYGLERAGGSAIEFWETFLSSGFKPYLLDINGTEGPVRWTEFLDRLPRFDSSDPGPAYLNVVFRR